VGVWPFLCLPRSDRNLVLVRGWLEGGAKGRTRVGVAAVGLEVVVGLVVVGSC